MSTFWGHGEGYAQAPTPRLPFCVICGEHYTVLPTAYTCPLCEDAQIVPCPARPRSAAGGATSISGQRIWQASPDTLARMHGGAA